MGINNTIRGGAGAGRGDDPHGPRIPTQAETDQHTIAHADNFIGPRVGETYGQGQPSVLFSHGGTSYRQPDPAANATAGGTAARMAHLDNPAAVGNQNPRMLQHKGSGNIVEQWNDYQGKPRVNEFGTTAAGKILHASKDTSISDSTYPSGPGNVNNSENWTDITDTVRGTQSYKNSL